MAPEGRKRQSPDLSERLALAASRDVGAGCKRLNGLLQCVHARIGVRCRETISLKWSGCRLQSRPGPLRIDSGVYFVSSW